MFRRLTLGFGLLFLALLAALLPAIVAGVRFADVRAELLVQLGVVAAAGLLAVAGLSAWLTRRFADDLRTLTHAAERLGEQGYGAHVFLPARDEVSRFGEAFNRMNEKLSKRIADLEEDRQQLRTILSGMIEGVVALDAEQRIVFANERAAQLLDFPTTSPVGRPLWMVVRHRQLLEAIRQTLETAEPHRTEVTWNSAEPRSLAVHAARLPGLRPRGAVVVLHDTTELRRLERLRHEFVANVSHELKTPLSVIQVCTETLLDGAIDDVQHRKQFLDQIARQGHRLHALILDLLRLARIESGDALFALEAVPVESAVRAGLDRHRQRAEARQQTLTAEAGPPAEVWVDEEALDQILENLLDNAVKYTPEGGRITAAWRVDGANACLEVRDTGIGIPQTDLPRIFERFYRVDKARSRELGGTGLGLAIVKHLVQAMRGSVSATSQVGEGTTFTVCLPLAPASPRSAEVSVDG